MCEGALVTGMPYLGLVMGCLLTAQMAWPYSGGTNSAGCHTNRSTGGYHCHNPKTKLPNRVTYCHVTEDGERWCGYAMSSCRNLTGQFGGRCEIEP